ncbi:MAG: nuclear transport factor 2 family protein [Acidimicrobiia bacterium]|nr:nuclear transport factor 2 family protein [Acidimicrobiia bacterium]
MSPTRVATRTAHQRNLSQEGPFETIKKLTHAWLRKNSESMARQLADDITELGPAFAKPIIGKRRFFEKYQAYFSGPLHIQSYRFLDRRVIELAPHLALVHFRYRMTTRNRGTVEQSSGQESILVELKRGRWRVKFIHWHRD